MRVTIVGVGRVGASLGGWLVDRGASVSRVGNLSSARIEAVARELSARAVDVASLVSDGDDLLLLAVPEGSIPGLARSLSERPQARVVLHTAGSVGAEPLRPLQGAGCSIGSLHPLRAFASTVPAADAARTFFAIDGDERAVEMARRLVAAWSGRAEVVAGRDRLLYHLAATMAAGGTATIVAEAMHLAESIGIGSSIRDAYLDLAQGALANLRSAELPGAAITGPAARGESDLLARQLKRLEERGQPASELVRLLAEHTLLALERSGRPLANAAEVRETLRRATLPSTSTP